MARTASSGAAGFEAGGQRLSVPDAAAGGGLRDAVGQRNGARTGAVPSLDAGLP